MMKAVITPKCLSGEVRAVFSKSDAHRILICAALSENPTRVFLDAAPEDIEATLSCLSALGAEITPQKGFFAIKPISAFQKDAVLDCGESGSTLRFLLPVALLGGQKTTFTGRGRLPERPIGALMGELRRKGCVFDAERLPFSASKKLESGRYVLPGDISSQFVTGLLLALPRLSGNSEIVLSSPLESKGYADMTVRTQKRFGVTVEETPFGYKIAGNQTYTAPREIHAEGDWSNAAFWLCAGAMGGDVTCSGLDEDSAQGDRAIVPILSRFGALCEREKDRVRVRKGELTGIEIDASEIPDLVPVLAVTAAAARGRTVIYNAARLRLKECDRLSASAELLKTLGAQVDSGSDRLEIIGNRPLTGGAVNAHNDHRMVMSAAIASILCEKELTIDGALAVNKSYPGFFRDFNRLGGNANVFDNGE